MGGISSILDIAKGALIAQQTATEVASHNVSNVNTEGYSHQRANMVTNEPVRSSIGLLGSGVVTDIKSAYDKFINMRIHTELSTLSELEVRKDYMASVETIFNEMGDFGLNSMFSQFWAAWEDLANNPGGTTERVILLEKGNLLTHAFNTIHQDLDQLRHEIEFRVDEAIKNVNQLASQIAELNLRILEYEVGGNSANDLRDQRSLAVEELSQFIDINYFEDETGMLTIFVGRGNVLVEGKNYASLEMTVDGSGNLVINWVGSGGSKVDITDYIDGGKLGGWLTVRDELIPQYESDLNALAASVIVEVNRQHSQGVGLEAFTSVTGAYTVADPNAQLASQASGLPFWGEIVEGQSFTIWVYDSLGNPTQNDITIAPGWSLNDLITYINTNVANVTASEVDGKLQLDAASGYSFAFSNDSSNVLMALGVNTFFIGKDANTIGINSTVSDNPTYIAAARIESDGTFAEGDNRNALDISDIKDTTYTISGTEATFDEFLSSLVGKIGSEADGTSRNYTFHEFLINQFKETRESIQGVSLDEEMTNLIQFQYAYQAAAKLVQMADEMLQTLLEMK